MEYRDIRDVHDLVALMSVAIGMDHHHTNRVSDIPMANIIGGIVDYEDGNERTFPVLDSLANICVSRPKGEVVAVALQLQIDLEMIRLTIAKNDDVERNLVSYLTMIWNMLRALASQFAKERAQGSKASEWNDFVEVSPPIPPDVGRQLRMKIFRQIYTYTQEKNRHRVQKHWDGLHVFMKRFYATRQAELEGYELHLDTAYQALRCVFKEYDPKPIEEQDDLYWTNLFALLEVATNRVKKIAGKNNYWCNTLSVEENPTALTVFNLRRALLKMTSQHRHYQTLISFAHSPRLNPVFKCQISIMRVPVSEPRLVRLPRTTAAWLPIINKIVPTCEIGGDELNWQAQEALVLGNKFPEQRVRSAPIHCECRLIEYLRTRCQEGKRRAKAEELGPNHKKRKYEPRNIGPEPVEVGNVFVGDGRQRESVRDTAKGKNVFALDTNELSCSSRNILNENSESVEYRLKGQEIPGKTTGKKLFTLKRTWEEMESPSELDGWETVPIFSYLGVSKLSCSACKLWIEAYNQQERVKYYTRGSHGKWYWPWGLPQLDQAQLSKCMVEKIGTIYREHCRGRNRMKPLSDGSTAPTRAPSPTHPIDESVAESIYTASRNVG